MDTFRVESVFLPVTADKAFRFIAEPANLPEWTHAFRSVEAGKAVMATPARSVDVSLTVNSSREAGTIDWHMKFPDGSAARAYSRLVPAKPDACVFSFVLLAPPVPLEMLEGTLNEQAQVLREELAKLRTILAAG